MLAWEWTLDKAGEREGEVEKKAATRKISQTAQVKERGVKVLMFEVVLPVLGILKRMVPTHLLVQNHSIFSIFSAFIYLDR